MQAFFERKFQKKRNNYAYALTVNIFKNIIFYKKYILVFRQPWVDNIGMLRCCRAASPLGSLSLAAEGGKLVGLWMEDQRFFGEPFQPLPPCGEAIGVLADACRWLDAYWAGRAPNPLQLPLAPQGSAFRQKVWKALLTVPYGQTRSYGALAQQVGSSARAVGGAVGRNPIAIIIPCHRITAADGSLTGYAGGTERKRFLLAAEQGSLFPRG